MHPFRVLLFLYFFLASCFASTSSTTKAARVSTINGKPSTIATSTSRVSSATKTRNVAATIEEQQTKRSKPMLQSMLVNAKDELQDIGEGFIYAESNSERFDHLVDVVIRHRVVLGAVAGGYLLKSRILAGQRAQQVAKNVVKNLHADEISKWGRRLA